jgi:hypothetical protein
LARRVRSESRRFTGEKDSMYIDAGALVVAPSDQLGLILSKRPFLNFQ